MKLKKGSAEAKRFMASIRAKKKGAKKTAVKKTAVKKAPKKVAVKKASTHKDTKSHNVKISVVSGVNRNFRKFKVYKKHIIDIIELTKGGNQYIVNSTFDGKDIPIFFAKTMSQAKIFIDRTDYLLKKYFKK